MKKEDVTKAKLLKISEKLLKSGELSLNNVSLRCWGTPVSKTARRDRIVEVISELYNTLDDANKIKCIEQLKNNRVRSKTINLITNGNVPVLPTVKEDVKPVITKKPLTEESLEPVLEKKIVNTTVNDQEIVPKTVDELKSTPETKQNWFTRLIKKWF